jgi:hypothetical protein
MSSHKKIHIICSDVYKNLEVHYLLLSNLISGIGGAVFVDIRIDSVFGDRVSNYSLDYNDKSYDVIRIKSLSSLYKLLHHDCIVISMFSEEFKDWWIHLFIKYCDAKLVYINNLGSAINFSFKPRFESFRVIQNTLKLFSAIFFKAKRLIPNRAFYYLIRLNVFQKVDVLYLSNKELKSKIENRYYGKHDRIKLVNSAFYDASFEYNYPVSNQYIVFLDSMPPYHGDQIIYGYLPIKKDLYYSALDELFGYIERVTGKEIIICLHPKYDTINSVADFKKRKSVKNKTQFYIAQASLVLFHDTSAVNSAFIYNKNVIQLFTPLFNDFYKNLCDQYYDKLNVDRINFTDKEEFCEINKIMQNNKQKTSINSFISNNIISSGFAGQAGYSQIIDDLCVTYNLNRVYSQNKLGPKHQKENDSSR